MSRVHKPINWVTHTVILFKILFQELVLLGLNWDDELPTRWRKYVQDLCYFKDISLARPIEFEAYSLSSTRLQMRLQ